MLPLTKLVELQSSCANAAWEWLAEGTGMAGEVWPYSKGLIYWGGRGWGMYPWDDLKWPWSSELDVIPGTTECPSIQGLCWIKYKPSIWCTTIRRMKIKMPQDNSKEWNSSIFSKSFIMKTMPHYILLLLPKPTNACFIQFTSTLHLRSKTGLVLITKVQKSFEKIV